MAAHKQSTAAISMRHTIRARYRSCRVGRPPGARLRPGDDAYPGSPRSCGTPGTCGAPGAGAGAGGAAAGVAGAGRPTLKPLMIASVASAAATTWSTLVVTDNVTRY